MMEEEREPHSAWKLRFIVGVIMLSLAFLGMSLTNAKTDFSWDYWFFATPVFALITITLSMYLRYHKLKTVLWTVWHEIFHWIGLFLAVLLVHLLIKMGLISRYVGGIQVLLLLALAIFLAGVYTEPTLIIIGIILGLFVAFMGFINVYFYFILIPIIFLGALALYWLSRHKKNHKHTSDE